MKSTLLWICLIAIVLNCFAYTFNVEIRFEDAFNLTVGTFIDIVNRIFGYIQMTYNWIFGESGILNALSYIGEITGLNQIWETVFPPATNT